MTRPGVRGVEGRCNEIRRHRPTEVQVLEKALESHVACVTGSVGT